MPTQSVYRDYANQVADSYGIPRDLFSATIQQESGFNPNAKSSAGAYGLGQLMPGTAADLGVNRYDWRENLEGSGKYLRQQFDKFGNWALALSAYNSGPGGSEKYGSIENNPETQNYVDSIFSMLGEEGLDALFSFVPGMGGLDGSTVLGPAKEGIKDTVEKVGDWKDALAGFFSGDTMVRGVAVIVGIVFLIGGLIAILASNKQVQQVVKTTAKTAAKLAV